MEKLRYKPFPCLRVVCNKCGFEIHTKKKLETDCKHPNENHRYKIVVTIGKTGKKKTKTLETRDYLEATNEVVKFKRLLQAPIIEVLNNTDSKVDLLIDCMAMYIDYLHGNEELYQNRKDVSKSYANDCVRYLKEFKKFLEKDLKLPAEELAVDFVNDKIVSKYCEYIDNMDKSLKTLQKYITTMKTFYNYLIDIKKYDIKNYFTKVTIKGINRTNKKEPKTEIVNFITLYRIIPFVTRENGWTIFKTGCRRNMFRPYLVDGFRLGLLIGRRCTEICYMKWSDIKYNSEAGTGYMIVLDSKSTQLSKTKTEKYAFSPITKQLMELLIELGYEKYKGQDRYIIASDDKSDRKNISKNLSKWFSHFVKFINHDMHLMFKGLRKNYITMLDIHRMGGNIRTEDITGHSNFDVIDNHYLDKAEKSLSISGDDFKL